MLPELISGLAGAGLAAGGYLYAAMWPPSQIFGRSIVAGNDPAEVALTYDDGPNSPETPRLLEILARHQVRATFFLVGRYVQAHPQTAREIAAAGHLIGNHTLTHPNLAWIASSEIRRQLSDTNDILEQTIGQRVRYFRPPFGARRPATLRIGRELGLTAVQWNIAAQDWKPATPEQLLARVEKGIARNRKAGSSSNVLLHDGGHLGLGQPRMPTVEATRILLERHISELRFVTPDAWDRSA